MTIMTDKIKDPRFMNELPEGGSIGDYLSSYADRLKEGLATIASDALDEAHRLLQDVLKNNRRIYVAGNGGSAAIADHLCCDFSKGTYLPNKPSLRVQSLVANGPLLTALGNDYGYDKTLDTQVEIFGEKGDVVILISSSGNSPNIVKAAEAARAKGMTVIGLSGFSGGKLRELSHVSLYVPINNYGIVEDAHQCLMHVLAQYLARSRDAIK